MPDFAASTIALDFTTLFVVAICVTGLLGLLLLFAWTQDRVRALAWWGTAYLVGGASVVIWSVESHIWLPAGTANAMLFVACGMMWNAARLFHGRPVLWGAMVTGATIWLTACLMPEFVQSPMARVVLSSVIVSGARLLIERFAKRREPVSVLVFDLDHFKKINDHYGHAIGDEAIRLFASVASTNMRASDILGRFGGEEFVAVLPGSVSDAAVAAERVRAAFETAGVTGADRPLGATVSIGVASGEPGADGMSLIGAAGRGPYPAEGSGGN